MSKNIITELNRIRRISESYGGKFSFNSEGAVISLPEKSAPFILDSIEQELFEAGFLPLSEDGKGVGNIMFAQGTPDCPPCLVFHLPTSAEIKEFWA